MKIHPAIRTALACSLMAVSVPIGLTGCTPDQQASTKVAVARVVAYEPEVQTAVDTLSSVLQAILPADAALIQVAQVAFDTDMQVLTAAVNAYTATPNTGTFNAIVTALNTVLADNADQFLAAARISNPQSIAVAKTAIAGVRVILLLMDGALQGTQPPAAVAATAHARNLKLRELEPYLTPAEKTQIAHDTGHSFQSVWSYKTAQGF